MGYRALLEPVDDITPEGTEDPWRLAPAYVRARGLELTASVGETGLLGVDVATAEKIDASGATR